MALIGPLPKGARPDLSVDGTVELERLVDILYVGRPAYGQAESTPAVLISMIMLWGGDYTPKVQWTLSVLILGFWLGFCFALRERVVLPLQTLSNLLAALREGDYSIRARGASREEALGQVMLEANALGETLRSQRLGALEATTLLRKVMEEIEGRRLYVR